MYRTLFDLLLRRIPAETAHRCGFGLIRLAGLLPGGRWLLHRLLAPRDPVLAVRALGLQLPGPLGLAAGFDKDAEAPDALVALGFGFVEVGTVTARPQPGNPKPRLFRLTADRALINRMGFNNAGSREAARRLAARALRPGVVGANIGRSKVVAEPEAVTDYLLSTRLLAGVCDYLVVNVSSPNTPGLRALQAVDKLRPLLSAVRDELDQQPPRTAPGRDRGRLPLLVKIAPELSDEELDAVADLALQLGLDGIIATNTSTARDQLSTPAGELARIGAGGLSGAPLADRSLAVLRRLRARVGDRMVLISVGGIETGDDAWERIRAGATLLQAYTGFVYGGPLWPRRVQRQLAARIRAAGFDTIEAAIGSAAGREL